MKQLGNLAIVCAQRPDVLLQIHNGIVTLSVGIGPYRRTIMANWDDDQKNAAMIHALNYGPFSAKACGREEAPQEVL